MITDEFLKSFDSEESPYSMVEIHVPVEREHIDAAIRYLIKHGQKTSKRNVAAFLRLEAWERLNKFAKEDYK